MKIFTMLFATAMLLTACTKSGDEFEGKWFNVQKNETIEIVPNGDAYLLSVTAPSPLTGTVKTTKIPAVLENGALKVTGLFGAVTFVVDKKTGIMTNSDNQYTRIVAKKDEVPAAVQSMLDARVYRENLSKDDVNRHIENQAIFSKNFEEALTLFIAAAEKGNKYAQYQVAFQLSHHDKSNLEKAFYWYQKAADQGLPIAINNLADMYETGNGVSKDHAKAIKLYEKVANLGHSWGFFSIGSLYERGVIKSKDYKMAYLYFCIATKLERSHSERRDGVALLLSPQERQRAEDISTAWQIGDPLP